MSSPSFANMIMDTGLETLLEYTYLPDAAESPRPNKRKKQEEEMSNTEDQHQVPLKLHCVRTTQHNFKALTNSSMSYKDALRLIEDAKEMERNGECPRGYWKQLQAQLFKAKEGFLVVYEFCHFYGMQSSDICKMLNVKNNQAMAKNSGWHGVSMTTVKNQPAKVYPVSCWVEYLQDILTNPKKRPPKGMCEDRVKKLLEVLRKDFTKSPAGESLPCCSSPSSACRSFSSESSKAAPEHHARPRQ